MYTQSDILSFMRSHKDEMRQRFGIEELGLFGSYARGEQHEGSDIDVLIQMCPGTTDIFEKRMALKDYLSSHFKVPVDVCHKQAIKPVFRQLILNDLLYV